MFWENLTAAWPYVVSVLQVGVALAASAHVVLKKNDERSAIGWVGLIWLVPLLGAVLYVLFGINRIRRRASDLRPGRLPDPAAAALPAQRQAGDADAPPGPDDALAGIAPLLDRITGLPLTAGNRIDVLETGHDAFRAVLEAIGTAQHSVGLASYIFDYDRLGRVMLAALARAQARGIAVRVLVDGLGGRYSRPPITPLLLQHGIAACEFLPTRLPRLGPFANLRNHRKILVVDGTTGFTGGMNIREGHLAGPRHRLAIADVHFRLCGPVVAHLAATFAEDWLFAASEPLVGSDWFPDLPQPGTVPARGIAAGPDEAVERIRWAILGALSAARRRARIVTPYFLPDHGLTTALRLAALRGVAVEIVLPQRGNLRIVDWASRARLSDLLASGCRIWLTPPPFDHAKLMTIDDHWSLIGSANFDSRSLRLNFEFNVECYGRTAAAAIDRLVDRRIARARPYTPADDRARSIPRRLRDGTAWLLSPYL
jgi:cardiolipin synthase